MRPDPRTATAGAVARHAAMAVAGSDLRAGRIHHSSLRRAAGFEGQGAKEAAGAPEGVDRARRAQRRRRNVDRAAVARRRRRCRENIFRQQFVSSA